MGTKPGAKFWMVRWRVDFSALLLIAFVFQLVWPIVVFAAPDLPDEYETALRNTICQVVVEEAEQTPTQETLGDFVCDWCVTSQASFDDFDLSVIEIQYPLQNKIRGLQPFIEIEFGPENVVYRVSGPRAPPAV